MNNKVNVFAYSIRLFGVRLQKCITFQVGFSEIGGKLCSEFKLYICNMIFFVRFIKSLLCNIVLLSLQTFSFFI